MKNQSGQGLVELVVALSVAAIVLGALIISVTTGLKNAQYAQNQATATKLSQDTIEKIRIMKEYNIKDGVTLTSLIDPSNNHSPMSIREFIESTECDVAIVGCTFELKDTSPTDHKLNQIPNTFTKAVGNNHRRQINILNIVSGQKLVIAKITWTDSAGSHESNVQTILTAD